jgi:vacuolar-type H+-ATPase subunit H
VPGAGTAADGADTSGGEDAAGSEQQATDGAHTVVAGPGADQAAAPGAVETLKVTTTAEASAAATRLLEIAGRSADQLVSEAEERAGQIVGEAKSTAEQLETGARSRAEALETETEERRKTLVADVEQEKARLDAEIDKLRTFEREYRAELRTYFEEQLAALDGQGAGGFLGRSADRDDTAPSTPAGNGGADQSGEQHSAW